MRTGGVLRLLYPLDKKPEPPAELSEQALRAFAAAQKKDSKLKQLELRTRRVIGAGIRNPDFHGKPVSKKKVLGYAAKRRHGT